MNIRTDETRLDYKIAAYITKTEKEWFAEYARRKGISESAVFKEFMRIGKQFVVGDDEV